MPVNNLVSNFIKLNKVAVFSKSYCPFCYLAKGVLYEAGEKSPAVMELDKLDNGSEIQEALTRISNSKTVPCVYINQKFVGGGTDVQRLLDTGELFEMLKACQPKDD